MSKFPSFLRKKFEPPKNFNHVVSELNNKNLGTVCVSAKCPNRFECFNKGTATFLILGPHCTRMCKFCAVDKGIPAPIDYNEPKRLADFVEKFNIRHVVITSVTRDDLSDGGAEQFIRCINILRKKENSPTIEVLIPDLNGNTDALKKILDAKPDILNHNIETVSRLYSMLRPQADYKRSLKIIEYSHKYDSKMATKSGLMVGLGETEAEVLEVMKDLIQSGCMILTIGQYFKPHSNAAEITSIVEPAVYERYIQIGKYMGFKKVFAGAYVRSSYMAEEIFREI